MILKRFIISVAAIFGLLVPILAFAGTGTIDPVSDSARLCGSADCTTYTTVNWRPTNGAPAVQVTDSALSGFIWSENLGWINLSPTNGGVHNTTSGVLSGYAWGSTAGWVNFSPANGGVSINTSTGQFSGYAWLSGGGWMRFDCSLTDACVKTDWRPTTTVTTTCNGNCSHTIPTKCLDTAAANYGGDLPCTYVVTTICKDPSASNYNAAGACSYSTTLCSDPGATNYGSSGACTYTTTTKLCADPAAANYGASFPCSYAITKICNDPNATNYHSVGSCTYATTKLCLDHSAANYGGGLPCTYPTGCTDSSAINYGAAGACIYSTLNLCLDHASSNYGAPLPCIYATTICRDSSALNYGAAGSCRYKQIIDTTDGGGICPVSTATSTVGIIIDGVKGSYCNTKLTIDKTWGDVQKIIASKKGDTATKIATTTGLLIAASMTIASGLFLNPISFSEIFLIPARLWSLLMAALGLKKRRRPWGTVYDSITKQPLDPAYVTLRNSQGAEIASSITDLDGRFGFVVPEPGDYTLVAHKTNYVFPSQKLVGHDHDELYRDLYFGEYFHVAKAGDIVIKNIPMDPEHFDWNEFAKRQQGLMKFYSKRDRFLRRLSDTLFGIGFVIASIAILFAPKVYNIVVFLLYCVLFFVRVHGVRSRPFGYVADALTGSPIPFSVIRISSASTGVEIMHRITDAEGRYYALLPNGEYLVRLDRKLPDGAYEIAAEGLPASVTKGYLAKTFAV